MVTPDSGSTKRRFIMDSLRYGEFDLEQLVNDLCHSHAPHTSEKTNYNAQVAILRLIAMLEQSDEPDGFRERLEFVEGRLVRAEAALLRHYSASKEYFDKHEPYVPALPPRPPTTKNPVQS